MITTASPNASAYPQVPRKTAGPLVPSRRLADQGRSCGPLDNSGERFRHKAREPGCAGSPAGGTVDRFGLCADRHTSLRRIIRRIIESRQGSDDVEVAPYSRSARAARAAGRTTAAAAATGSTGEGPIGRTHSPHIPIMAPTWPPGAMVPLAPAAPPPLPPWPDPAGPPPPPPGQAYRNEDPDGSPAVAVAAPAEPGACMSPRLERPAPTGARTVSSRACRFGHSRTPMPSPSCAAPVSPMMRPSGSAGSPAAIRSRCVFAAAAALAQPGSTSTSRQRRPCSKR